MFSVNLLNINKTQSSIIKGFAILIMIFHHFYGMYEIPDANEIIDTLREDSIFNLFRFFAKIGKFCVLLFAFVTGYGYFNIVKQEKLSIFKSTCTRLSNFYPFYVFIVVGIYLTMLFFPSWLKLTFEKALLQCCGVLFIPDYWYITVVLVGALFYFPILLYSYRKSEAWHIACFWALIIVNYFSYPLYNLLISDCSENNLLTCIPVKDTCVSISYLLLGYACGYINEKGLNLKNTLMLGLPALLNVQLLSWDNRYILIILSILFLVQLKCIKSSFITPTLVILGKYSACMWLNHRLIFGYWFSDTFYAIPSPLNYLIVIIFSFLLSITITKIWESLKSLRRLIIAKMQY